MKRFNDYLFESSLPDVPGKPGSDEHFRYIVSKYREHSHAADLTKGGLLSNDHTRLATHYRDLFKKHYKGDVRGASDARAHAENPRG